MKALRILFLVLFSSITISAQVIVVNPYSIAPLFSPTLQAKFDVLWIGGVSGNNLIDVISGKDIAVTSKDFSGNYIPSTSTATFALQNDATLKTDDSPNNFWFTSGGAVNQKTVANLIGTDNTRTFIKYSNTPPYNIYWIGLLKSAATLTAGDENELSAKFQLWLYYFRDALNPNGFTKDNRTVPTSNLVTNGTFDVDASWTKNTGWTISSGVANSNNLSGFNILSQSGVMTIGLTYRLKFDMTYTSGTLRVDSANPNVDFTTSGSKDITFISDQTALRFVAFNGFVGTIDNVRLFLIP